MRHCLKIGARLTLTFSRSTIVFLGLAPFGRADSTEHTGLGHQRHGYYCDELNGLAFGAPEILPASAALLNVMRWTVLIGGFCSMIVAMLTVLGDAHRSPNFWI